MASDGVAAASANGHGGAPSAEQVLLTAWTRKTYALPLARPSAVAVVAVTSCRGWGHGDITLEHVTTYDVGCVRDPGGSQVRVTRLSPAAADSERGAARAGAATLF